MLHGGQLLSFLNIWTTLSACISAFTRLLVFGPLCKMVHEVAQGMGLLTHTAPYVGTPSALSMRRSSRQHRLDTAGDPPPAGLKARFDIHTVNRIHLRHMCRPAKAGQLAGIFLGDLAELSVSGEGQGPDPWGGAKDETCVHHPAPPGPGLNLSSTLWHIICKSAH